MTNVPFEVPAVGPAAALAHRLRQKPPVTRRASSVPATSRLFFYGIGRVGATAAGRRLCRRAVRSIRPSDPVEFKHADFSPFTFGGHACPVANGPGGRHTRNWRALTNCVWADQCPLVTRSA